MKLTFLQIGIQREFPQLVDNPTYYLNITFSLVFGVDENIIQIYNDKDMEFFRKDFIKVALEYCRSVGQSKRHHLIFKVAVSSPKSSLPLIFFANSHLVVSTGEVELDKLLCLL